MSMTSDTDQKVTLLPQEREGRCRFDAPLVSTANALGQFGDGVILTARELVRNEAATRGGLDYLQVLEVAGRTLWLIDDGDVVTALLPEDY